MDKKLSQWHLSHRFTQQWPEYTPLEEEWDDIDIDIVLQDILCPADEADLSIAKDLLTRIGIKC
jgi:hypothetical protein